MITHYDLFSGIGGFSIAVDEVFGRENTRHVFVEREPFCQAVLKKHWPKGEYYGDINGFIADTRTQKSRGLSSVKRQKNTPFGFGSILTGGFPCQPFSAAGRRKGTGDDRYLWPQMFECIKLLRPDWLIAENVAGLLTWNNGMVLKQVCADLESEGYEVQPFVIPAVAVNAPHRRDRVWIVGNYDKYGNKRQEQKVSDGEKSTIAAGNNSNATDTTNKRGERLGRARNRWEGFTNDAWNENWLEVARRFCKFYDGLSSGLAGHLTKSETYGIMGFILTIREANYAKTDEARKKALSVLREAIPSQSVSEFFGRFRSLYEKKILRCIVHGKSYDEREKDEVGILKVSDKVKKELLRELRKERELAYSSQGYGLEKQCSCKFDDIVRELSSEIALGEWENNAKKTQKILFDLWQKSGGERFLHEPLSALYEIWKSITDKEIGAFRRHYYKRDDNRTPRLKALGNAIVPQVAVQILRGIKHAIEETI